LVCTCLYRSRLILACIILLVVVAALMYYAAMEIYLITREQQVAEIRHRESRDKCSERVAACNSKMQMNCKRMRWQRIRNPHTNLMEKRETHMERDTRYEIGVEAQK